MRTVHTRILSVALFLTVCTVMVGFVTTASGADAPSISYNVDPVHSSVFFRVNHMGIANVYGRFNEVSGTIQFDESDPAKTAIEVEVKAESIDTNNEKRDQHLKSPDFFNAAQFPVLSFKSKTVKKLEGNQYEVEGDFTMHGVTKPLTLKFEYTGSGKGPRGDQRIGGETTFTLKRSDFGMNFMPDGIGDEIRVMISLECIQK